MYLPYAAHATFYRIVEHLVGVQNRIAFFDLLIGKRVLLTGNPCSRLILYLRFLQNGALAQAQADAVNRVTISHPTDGRPDDSRLFRNRFADDRPTGSGFFRLWLFFEQSLSGNRPFCVLDTAGYCNCLLLFLLSKPVKKAHCNAPSYSSQ